MHALRRRPPEFGRAAAGIPAVALAVVLLLSPPGGASGAARTATSASGTTRARVLMGAPLSIETDGVVPVRVLEEAFAEVARLEDVLSNWRDTSEISRLNRAAAGAPARCSPDLCLAVGAALRWAERTGGAFDPTVEPLVRALGLRGEDGRLPGSTSPGKAPSEPIPPLGWRHVHFDARAATVRFDASGTGLDLGGIGKGIALDAAARVLRRHGVRRALLDFGGQVLALGHPAAADGWEIGIAEPDDREQVFAAISVDDRSVATSGNAERSAATPRGRVGHILDPATGQPAKFSGSVTVEAGDATSADALSTALYVMGPKAGLAWAEARRIGALYVWRDGSGVLRHQANRAFEERFRGALDGIARAERPDSRGRGAEGLW